jgi:hypothetical protein
VCICMGAGVIYGFRQSCLVLLKGQWVCLSQLSAWQLSAVCGVLANIGVFVDTQGMHLGSPWHR